MEAFPPFTRLKARVYDTPHDFLVQFLSKRLDQALSRQKNTMGEGGRVGEGLARFH